MRILFLVGPLFILAACSTTTAPDRVTKPNIVPASTARPAVTPTGSDRIIGKDARSLVALFGSADQDVIEAEARKLQFGSGTCVLDAYLYPPSKGKEPVVTYIDTRLPDGKDIDKAQCISALTKR